MRKISASELGAYLYCHRSWWYARQGEISANQAELIQGKQVHLQHSQTVKFSILFKFLSILISLAGIALLIWSLQQ